METYGIIDCVFLMLCKHDKTPFVCPHNFNIFVTILLMYFLLFHLVYLPIRGGMNIKKPNFKHPEPKRIELQMHSNIPFGPKTELPTSRTSPKGELFISPLIHLLYIYIIE